MAHKKTNKYPAKNHRVRRAGPIIVKAGAYNGSTSSSNFIVSGHSTGSPNSEMEAISQQLSKDVGNIPEIPLQYKSNRVETGYDDYEGEGLGDLGGPEFYGKKPTLLRKSPIHFAKKARRLTVGTAAVAITGSAILVGLAYALLRKVSGAGTLSQTKREPAKVSTAKRATPKRSRSEAKSLRTKSVKAGFSKIALKPSRAHRVSPTEIS